MATNIKMAQKRDTCENTNEADKIYIDAKTDMKWKMIMFKNIDFDGKNFGFSKVSWTIKNYCVIPFNKDKLFYSPEFYVRGYRLTKWRMIITRSYKSKDSYDLVFCLQRLPYDFDSDNEKVLVDYCLEYNDHHGENLEIEEINKTFFVHVENYEDHDLIRGGITPINGDHADVFKIQLEILVYFQAARESFPLCSNIGITALSSDMSELYDSGLRSNLKLNFQDSQLDVHKDVLFHRIRNENFRNKIQDNAVISLEDFTFEPSEDVIRFLYTGNLTFTVFPPSLGVFKISDFLGVKPILDYYDPDEIILHSNIEVEEYYTTWTIEDFSSRDDEYLQSPVMINSLMDTKWRLLVYPKVLEKDENCVQISLKYETESSKNICANLFLGKPGVRVSHTYHKIIVPNGVLRGINLTKRDNVINNFTTGDSLTVGLRLRMSRSDDNISVGVSKSSYKHLPVQRNYDRLSQDILSIYESEKFANIRFYFNDHNIIIDAHEDILDIRCQYLYFTLDRRDMKYFRNVNVAVIFEIFYFIYSGILREHLSLEDIFCLYRTANNFNISNLTEVITIKLTLSLCETNVNDVLQFAEAENIECLRDKALIMLHRIRNRD